MRIFVIKSVKLLLLFVALIWIFGFYLEYQFTKDNSDKFNWLRNKENNSYNYAFIGSSRVDNMIEISLIDKVLKTKGINLGIDGVDFRTMYMILYSFLEIQDNKIGELYIQVDPFMLYKDSVYNKPNYDHYFYDKINYEEIKSSITENNRLYFYNIFPALKYAEFNSVYNLTLFIRSFSKISKWDSTRGSSLSYNQIPFNPEPILQNKTFNKYIKFNEEDKAYLFKILDLCSKNSIQPVFYGAPIYEYVLRFKPSYPNFHKEIILLANEFNIEYLNFMEENYDKSFFRDRTHMNYKGSINFTEKLIKVRAENILGNKAMMNPQNRQ